MHLSRAGRFILATNVLESKQLSPQQALAEYKGQQGNERGFRFLKDPLFFVTDSMSSGIFDNCIGSIKAVDNIALKLRRCLHTSAVVSVKS